MARRRRRHRRKGRFAVLYKLMTFLLICGALVAALALFLYFCTPFPLVIRQVLALVVFSPVSALAPIFTARCGGDIGLAGFAGSISIILSIAAMTVCMMLMGI